MLPRFFDVLAEGQHEQVEILRDRSSALTAIVAIDDTSRGPAFGGIRRHAYRDEIDALRDVLRLSRAMTLKCAMARVEGGGGKTVIFDHDDLVEDEAYRVVGRHVQNLGGRYFCGPDIGTGERQLSWVAESTSYVTVPGDEGPGDLAAATARGVLAGLRAVAARLQRASLDMVELGGLSYSIQGIGEVGSKVARALIEAGARVFGVEVDQARAESAADLGVEIVEDVFDLECDVIVPCALGGIVHDLSVERARCRAIAGSANNVVASVEHAEQLHERGILLAPDFVINSGALILGAKFHLTGERDHGDAIDAIGQELFELFERADARGQAPLFVAEEIAQERLEVAKGRRYFPEGGRK